MGITESDIKKIIDSVESLNDGPLVIVGHSETIQTIRESILGLEKDYDIRELDAIEPNTVYILPESSKEKGFKFLKTD